MKTTRTEVKDDRGVTIGWITPRGFQYGGCVSYEYHCIAYRPDMTQTRTFASFNSAKNFILTGKTTLSLVGSR
jgi:hypothetical protein